MQCKLVSHGICDMINGQTNESHSLKFMTAGIISLIVTGHTSTEVFIIYARTKGCIEMSNFFVLLLTNVKPSDSFLLLLPRP